ncbi:MAG: hypothetical protein GFH27_549297n281 [Chloroflexi bacterium AL-W]|nr:hypothetical protein [Chloroflexi bacterium AL-N10]NOK82763.1 hypothetical protein [Chloroflexi bacterium AL-W]
MWGVLFLRGWATTHALPAQTPLQHHRLPSTSSGNLSTAPRPSAPPLQRFMLSAPTLHHSSALCSPPQRSTTPALYALRPNAPPLQRFMLSAPALHHSSALCSPPQRSTTPALYALRSSAPPLQRSAFLCVFALLTR